MFKHVHHVHYIVRSREAMVEYLEKNFGMKPTRLIDLENGRMKDALYNIGQTQLQITEPTDTASNMGKFLEKHGPGVYHVAWAVDDIRKVSKELAAKGNKMRGKDGITESPHGYLTSNIDTADTHGIVIQLAEGPI